MNEVAKPAQSGALAITDSEMIGVLQSSLYPGAALSSIKMVLDYCKAAGLDPLQKPVHIVPMWNSKAGAMQDVIMPGVNLYRTQAARSGQFAGMSEPDYGPDITTKIGGVEITYPEWCRVTVKRILDNGVIAEFTSREYWIENYAVKGGKEKSIAPNAMWLKRPRGQIAKCTSAQALRIAFPEIASQPTADEMEGKQLYQAEVDITPAFSQESLDALIAQVNAAKTPDEVAAIWSAGVIKIRDAKDMTAYTVFKNAVSVRGAALTKAAETASKDDFVQAMDAASENDYTPE